MYKAYKYLFYKLYIWGLKLHGADDVPEFSSILAISILVLINILSFPLIIEACFGVQIPFPDPSKAVLASIFILYITANYIILIARGKHKKIAKEFATETDKERRKGTVYVWVYIVGTLFLFFFSIVVIMLRNPEKYR